MSQTPQPRTSVIISNLSKDDFVRQNSPLSLADSIKLAVLNLAPDEDILPHISHWSNLPFLNRIIIIFDSEAHALPAYNFLSEAVSSDSLSFSLPASVKVSLQENLLRRSKSNDNLRESNELNVTASLERFRSHHNSGTLSDYKEPEPQSFDPALDLKRLGIDPVSADPTSSNVSDSTSLSGSPAPQLGRSKSVTRTLFKPKPSLKILTANDAADDSPDSPTITLDELV